MSSPAGLTLSNITHHALASIARRTDPDKIPQVPYQQKGSQYGYPSLDGLRNGGPTLWITALLLGLYAASTVTHLGQAIHSRKWFLIPSAVACGLVEVIGWAGRTWSAKNPYADTPFLMQISTTVFAPTFLSGANFIILGHIIRESKGERYSRLSLRKYWITFVSLDALALFIQIVGGALATSHKPSHASGGADVMLVGMIISLITILAFTAHALEFFYRITTNSPLPSSPSSSPTGEVDSIELVMRNGGSKEGIAVSDAAEESGVPKLTRKLKFLFWSVAFSTFCLVIRAVYRTIELGGGWDSGLIQYQEWFNVFDGDLITVAMLTLNVFHPGRLLQPSHSI